MGAGDAGAPPDMAVMEQVRREIDELKKAIEANPKDVTALTRLGNLYMDAGMFDRAAQFYGDALAVDATLVDVRTDMGTCLRRMGRPQEALDAFQASVRQDPAHWKSWFNIGVVCLYDLQRYEEAEKAFEQVLALNPGSFDMNAVREEIRRLRANPAQGSQGEPS
jgi:tetratricopeptide (TPR) repeat protein